MFGDGAVIELLLDRVDGDDSILTDSDVVDVDGVCEVDGTYFRDEFVPLLTRFAVDVDASGLTYAYD